MASKAVLAIGTRKGLWVATSEDRVSWHLDGPHHPMTGVYAVAIDTRPAVPRLLAGVTSEHWGPSVATSDDLGVTWDEPDHAPIAFPADASLERVWQLQPGSVSQPGVVWAGTEPSALFRSTDGGRTYSFIEGLWKHPHRTEWGAGFGGQAVHSIVPSPDDPSRVTVAMSTGGVYRTSDGGASWEASNTGIKAYFMPDPYPEFGQCVHKIAQHASNPSRFYLQNHHGVYRSDDGGVTWKSIADGLPTDFGFAMVVHPHEPDTIYNFPIETDGRRFPPEGKCRVYRSRDAGNTWEALGSGLPDSFWTAVMRDAMCTDSGSPAGIYFGSRSGSVYASPDEGDHWHLVADNLPDVLSVRAAVIAS
ncbi:glycosyl hydrolase [Lentzea sp. NBRC 105346]|uniref:WD40/YVTN/BNR-like repeat-containing protein n=1 Tax=Lentzea sp. NBRC 105346 TaxID=3032205 RepID=UPI0024A59B3E|nr:exo-alpha-sialidase [Lentzea sp. NBRC 105346]GLZ31908.1 glycosyl hydrolase [Lentzea sp. NBRC 105346]